MEAFAFVSCNFRSFARVNTLFTLLVLFTMWNTVSSMWVENLHPSYCLDGMHHKSAPSPESSLYDQCSPWKNESCCTYNTTERIHNFTLYNLNFEQCHPLSESCKKHFIRDMCFYECSPDIGPWVEEVVGKKTRRERFRNVPLCQSSCDSWFHACQDDFVCSRNWIKDGTHCPNKSKCATVKDTYQTAKNFCEEIFDHSWEYTPEDEPCMKMQLDPAKPNENKIAKLAAIRRNDSYTTYHYVLIVLAISIILLSGFVFALFVVKALCEPWLFRKHPFSRIV